MSSDYKNDDSDLGEFPINCDFSKQMIKTAREIALMMLHSGNPTPKQIIKIGYAIHLLEQMPKATLWAECQLAINGPYKDENGETNERGINIVIEEDKFYIETYGYFLDEFMLEHSIHTEMKYCMNTDGMFYANEETDYWILDKYTLKSLEFDASVLLSKKETEVFTHLGQPFKIDLSPDD